MWGVRVGGGWGGGVEGWLGFQRLSQNRGVKGGSERRRVIFLEKVAFCWRGQHYVWKG